MIGSATASPWLYADARRDAAQDGVQQRHLVRRQAAKAHRAQHVNEEP
ncbi:hypothetical protein [Streptomyces sp. NPDC046978]